MSEFITNTVLFCSFWYVPFIMLVFICSMLYLNFIKVGLRYQLLFLFASTILSIIIGRYDYDPLQSMLYFSVFYLLGIMCAQYYKTILAMRKIYWVGIGILYIICVYVFALHNQYIPVSGHHFFSGSYVLDFLVLTKMAMCFLSIGIFNYFKQIKVHLLQSIIAVLAKYSFSIFFLHNFVLLATGEFLKETDLLFGNIGAAWAAGFLYSGFTCLLCILMAMTVKAITGKYSRYFIGA